MDSLISHIGIAVEDLQESIEKYRLLTGVEPSEIHDVPDQKVRVAFFASAGDHSGGYPRIELVAPGAKDSPIAKFLAKRGEGLHHVCLLVDDLEERLRQLSEAGVRLIDQTPRTGAEGDKIAFVHPGSAGGVLIELQEKKPTG